jgi:hypothetical protein
MHLDAPVRARCPEFSTSSTYFESLTTVEKSAVGMAKLTGHHWITHSAIVILLFFGIGAWLTRANGGQGLRLGANRMIAIMVSGVALAALIIVGFYLTGD